MRRRKVVNVLITYKTCRVIRKHNRKYLNRAIQRSESCSQRLHCANSRTQLEIGLFVSLAPRTCAMVRVPVGVHDEVVTFSKVLFVVRWNACVVHVDANGMMQSDMASTELRLCFQAHLQLKSHIPVACKEMNASVLSTVRVLELCR